MGSASNTQRKLFQRYCAGDRGPTRKDRGGVLLQLMISEGAEYMGVADDEAHVV